MSYPPPVPPPAQHHVQIQQPVVDKSRRFLNLSGGALLAITSGLLLVCCVGPVALCMFTPIFGAFLSANKVDPQVEVTSCTFAGSHAMVGLRVTNPGTSTESWTVKVEVRDVAGDRVGDGSAYMGSIPGGKTASETTIVRLRAEGGKTCHVTGVE